MKPESAPAKKESPLLAALQHKKEKLEKKIKERIPNFSKDKRDRALELAETHLANLNLAIKRESKAS